MTARFVLDESSWSGATADPATFPTVVLSLLERLEVAGERHEQVLRHSDFYCTDLGGGLQLFTVLFEPATSMELEHDVADRLRLFLDRMFPLDESELADFAATFEGKQQFAPGVAWAHARRSSRGAVAVLPLPTKEAASGVIDVAVQGVTLPLHFVTSDRQHLSFFRDAIVVEHVDDKSFPAIATSAFPDLDWVDGVWNELRTNKKFFFDEHRATFLRDLGALNDEGARLFHATPGGDGVEPGLAAKGVDASPENGRARSHGPSRKDRTRRYAGEEHVFWWHSKITYKDGRVHFLHVPHEPGSSRPPWGHIVIGILKRHCVLPD